MKTTKDFVFFWKTEEVFSQWHPSTFIIDDIVFKTAEQFMMYRKALTFGDVQAAARVLLTTDPREQKRIGRAVRNFDPARWSAIAKDVVYEGNKAKFTQNAEMLEQLLKTGSRELVEASPYDNIWGIGLADTDSRAYDKTQWQGTNWLGEILSRLRNELFAAHRSHGYASGFQKQIQDKYIKGLEDENKIMKDVLKKWYDLSMESDMRPEDECCELFDLTKTALGL